MQYHVCDLVIETRDKPFTVMVDTDADVLLDNVIRYIRTYITGRSKHM